MAQSGHRPSLERGQAPLECVDTLLGASHAVDLGEHGGLPGVQRILANVGSRKRENGRVLGIGKTEPAVLVAEHPQRVAEPGVSHERALCDPTFELVVANHERVEVLLEHAVSLRLVRQHLVQRRPLRIPGPASPVPDRLPLKLRHRTQREMQHLEGMPGAKRRSQAAPLSIVVPRLDDDVRIRTVGDLLVSVKDRLLGPRMCGRTQAHRHALRRRFRSAAAGSGASILV